jgi:Na+-translocating ferredoxin:NAD+ oxidoreductase subunit G
MSEKKDPPSKQDSQEEVQQENKGESPQSEENSIQLTEPPKGSFLSQAWLVLFLAICFGSGLAGIEIWLKPIIEQDKLNEALSQVPRLVPGATKGKLDPKVIPGRRVFRAINKAGQLLGWVVIGKGQGFADKVEILLGLNASATRLTGLAVLEQKETPGLGDNITQNAFTRQFAGLRVGKGKKITTSQRPADLRFGRIKAVTGATISSQTVCNIINKTVGKVQKPLASVAAK